MSLAQKYPREVEQIMQKYPPEQKRSAVMPSGGCTDFAASSGKGRFIGPYSLPKKPAVVKAFNSSFSPTPSRRWPMLMNGGITALFGPSTRANQAPRWGHATVCGGT